MSTRFASISAGSLLGVLLTLAVGSQVRADEPATTVDQLKWLAGAWIERKDSRDTEEQWMAPKGDLMLGVNRTVGKSGRASFEFLRIAKTPKGISYFASPGGAPATEFPLAKLEENKVVFENPTHDFPQRIIYWLDENKKLHARVEGTVNGQQRGMEWQWEKLGH